MAGFYTKTTAGVSNSTVFADNVDFTGGNPVVGQVTSNGQLLIGSSSSPNIRVGTLTAGTGISITNGAGSITIANTGATTDLHTARYIVSANGAADGANYTTIAAAITAASLAGGVQTVFIQPGTYTENLTLPANINLAANVCDAQTPNVTIIGKITSTDAGTRSISGIYLKTNSDNIIAITGTAATIVKLKDCYINVAHDVAAFACSSSGGAKLYVIGCEGDLNSATASYFAFTEGGLQIVNSRLFNSSLSTTVSTLTNASSASISYSQFNASITTSNTSGIGARYVQFRNGSANATILTINGTGTNVVNYCVIESGTASGISIGTGVNAIVTNCQIDSSNANAITGLGTITYSNITFTSSSSVINNTTQNKYYNNLGKYQAPGQPAFLANGGATGAVIGNTTTSYSLGASAVVTEIFDQDNNFTVGNGTGTAATFTAPVAGKYRFNLMIKTTGIVASTQGSIQVVTSNRTYIGMAVNMKNVSSSGSGVLINMSVLADMDAADTATFVQTASGEAGNVISIADCYICGSLEC